jgi:hypothetical protein
VSASNVNNAIFMRNAFSNLNENIGGLNIFESLLGNGSRTRASRGGVQAAGAVSAADTSSLI